MAGLSGRLLQIALKLKLKQIKLAMRDYLHDRAMLVQAAAGAYASAAALYAAAGIFLIAACLVGATALFRWIEIEYGMFWAFGAIGGLLVVIGALCAGTAASRLKRLNPRFPGLASRLRVAVITNPLVPNRVETVSNTTESTLLAPSTRRTRRRGGRELPTLDEQRSDRAILIMTATLLGWVLARRLVATRPDV